MEYAVIDLNTLHIFERFEHTKQGLNQAKILAIDYNFGVSPVGVCELNNDTFRVIWKPTYFKGDK